MLVRYWRSEGAAERELEKDVLLLLLYRGRSHGKGKRAGPDVSGRGGEICNAERVNLLM